MYRFIEGDASSASYFLAGAAITGGTVTVNGCGSESVQVSALCIGNSCMGILCICVLYWLSDSKRYKMA